MKTYSEIVGDGGSDINRQVTEQQQRVAANLSGVRRRLAIGSGKGGVGKSTLTAEIASALSESGRQVAILDADLNGPSQAQLAGLGSAPLLPGPSGLAIPRNRDGIGVVSLGSLVGEDEAVDFESVAKGESHTWRATREFAFLSQLVGSVAWGTLDYLLIDLPPGAERTFQFAEFFGPDTAFVLVTVPSDLSRGVVARSLSALQKTANPVLGYVENMSGYYCADCKQIKPLFAASDDLVLGIPRLGSVPFDPELGRGDRERPATRAVRETAKKIEAAMGAIR